MTEELNAKWRELLAAHRTWWSPGMLVQDGDRYTEESRYPRSVRVPDWTDPATLGCLLALVREAWGWPNAFACHDEIGWCVPSGETGCCVELQDEASDGERYQTEAEALVAALGAAEGQDVSDD